MNNKPPTERRRHDLAIAIATALATSVATVVAGLAFWEQLIGAPKQERATHDLVRAGELTAAANARQADAASAIKVIDAAAARAGQEQADATNQLVQSSRAELSITEAQVQALKGQLAAQLAEAELSHHPDIAPPELQAFTSALRKAGDLTQGMNVDINMKFKNKGEVPAISFVVDLTSVIDKLDYPDYLQKFSVPECRTLASKGEIVGNVSLSFTNQKVDIIPAAEVSGSALVYLPYIEHRGEEPSKFLYSGTVCVAYQSTVDMLTHHELYLIEMKLSPAAGASKILNSRTRESQEDVIDNIKTTDRLIWRD